jgi:hypothetical protein
MRELGEVEELGRAEADYRQHPMKWFSMRLLAPRPSPPALYLVKCGPGTRVEAGLSKTPGQGQEGFLEIEWKGARW